jgi:hypothetical protein
MNDSPKESGAPRGDWLNSLLARGYWAAAALLTVLFAISNYSLLAGHATGVWDADEYFYPYFVLISDSVRSLQPVFWDPWTNGGAPIVGEPDIGMLSPLTVFLADVLGGTSHGFVLYWLFMWWLGGMGMLLLARHLKAPAWAGLIVSLGFLFCGVYTGNAQHIPVVIAYSFIPWILWRFDAAQQSGSAWPAVEAGALWGVSALSGYPGLTILTGLFISLWAFGGSFWPRISDDSPIAEFRLRQRLTRMLRSMLIYGFTGIVVMSPAYFSFFYEGVGYHSRVGPLTRTWAVVANALHPGALATFASPYLPILKLTHHGLWAYTDISSCSIYAGVLVAVFSVLSLLRRHQPFRWWVAAIAVLSIGCALGKALPLRGWVYDFIPPTRYFRHSSWFRCYYIVSVCILALWGARDLGQAAMFRNSAAWRKLPFVAIAGGICAAAAIVRLAHKLGLNVFHFPAAEMIRFGVLWSAVIVIALLAASSPALRRQRLVIAGLILAASLDAWMTSRISSPTFMSMGRSSVLRWATLDHMHSREISPVRYERRLLDCGDSCYRDDQLIDKSPALNGYNGQESWFHESVLKSANLVQTAIGKERTWFAPNAVELPWTEPCFSEFEMQARVAGRLPLVVQAPIVLLNPAPGTWPHAKDGVGCPEGIRPLPTLERISVRLLRSEPDALDLSVEAPKDGWLLLTDRWARGWRAKINGKPAPIFCGNFIFRAVHVSAGSNRIEFRFVPGLTLMLAGLSWMTLAIVAWGTLSGARPGPKTNVGQVSDRLADTHQHTVANPES